MEFINNDSRPLYLRIKEYLEGLIENQTYKPGDRLPSENSLANELGVSRATLREALRVLEEEGKIVKHQGIGTFISEQKPTFLRGIEELVSVTETIENAGYKPGTTGLKMKLVKPSESLQAKVKLSEGEEILQLERIRTANGLPVVYCLDHLNNSYLYKEFSQEDFSGSLFNVLQNKFNISIKYALAQIIPVNADRALSKHLDISENFPLLLLEQYHYDRKDRMILFSQNYFRSDQFQFKVLRQR